MHRLSVNQHGFALVYSLVVLLLASVGGTALLFMAQKDHACASNYSQMRIASQAAQTAIKAFEGQMLNDPSTAVNLLQKYVDNPDQKYLLGNAPSKNELKFKVWGNQTFNGIKSPEYSVKILSFDKNNYYITIEGKGYGGNGGVKKAVASYQLAGIDMSNRPIGLTHGLFLGGQLENCNTPLSIQGDVYISAKGPYGPYNQHFNKGGKIIGNFKTASTTNFLEIGDHVIITGNAFIQCGLWPQKVLTIFGRAGFTYNFYNQNSNVEIFKDAYFRPASNLPSDNKIVGKPGYTVRYNSPATSSKFTGFGKDSLLSMTLADIATHLNMTSAEETPFGLNIPTWESGVVEDVSGNISGSTLDNYWTAHQTAGTLFLDEWLVLNVTSTVTSLGGTFSKKAIWLTGNSQINGNKMFYNCTDESNTLIIVNDAGAINNMGPGNNYNFRGMVYVNSTVSYSMNYQFGSNSVWYGAIHHANGTKFNLKEGDADSVRLWYSHPLGQSAIQEIVNTGIILAPGVTTPAPRILELTDIKIRPLLVNYQL